MDTESPGRCSWRRQAATSQRRPGVPAPRLHPTTQLPTARRSALRSGRKLSICVLTVKVARAYFECRRYTGRFYRMSAQLRKVGGQGSPRAKEPCPARPQFPEPASRWRARTAHAPGTRSLCHMSPFPPGESLCTRTLDLGHNLHSRHHPSRPRCLLQARSRGSYCSSFERIVRFLGASLSRRHGPRGASRARDQRRPAEAVRALERQAPGAVWGLPLRTPDTTSRAQPPKRRPVSAKTAARRRWPALRTPPRDTKAPGDRHGHAESKGTTRPTGRDISATRTTDPGPRRTSLLSKQKANSQKQEGEAPASGAN